MQASARGASAPDPLAAYGMGPPNLGMTTPVAAKAAYSQQEATSSPMPQTASSNLFGMPNLFAGSGFGASTAAGNNLFGNFFGGATPSTTAQSNSSSQQPVQQAQPSSGLQPPTGLYPTLSQQP